MRICDAQATAAESDALAALMVACIAQARCATWTRACRWLRRPRRMIEENMWRAIRFGMDGRLIDLRRARSTRPARRSSGSPPGPQPVRSELGISPSFPELNGAQRQRRMIASGATREEVFAASVEETRQTYTEVVKV